MRSTQCITDIYITITDGKNLILTVNIRNLMYKTVFLALAEDFQCFLTRNVASSLAGLHHIVRHIADSHAPAFRVICAAFIKCHTGAAAGTWTCRIFSVIFIQPVGNMFHGDRLILGTDCLLHRDNMHADSGTTLRYHRSHFFQRQPRHTFEETSHLRMLLQHFCIHIAELCTPRHEHRQHILFLVLWILPVILQHAVERHLFQQFFQMSSVHLGNLHHLI